jgi:hypothetical protein
MAIGQQRHERQPHLQRLAQHQAVDLGLGLPQRREQLIG